MRRTDDIDSLASLITHDPGAVLIAVKSDAIVGSAIAVRDGWRGTICRLAVAPPTGAARIGTAMVTTAVRRLHAVGTLRL